MWPNLPKCESPVSWGENGHHAQDWGVRVPQSRLPRMAGVLSGLTVPLQLLSCPPDPRKASRMEEAQS